MVLGPLLFLLFINDIQNSSKKFRFYLFADDTDILYVDKDLRSLEKVVNEEFKNVYKWLAVNKLTINIKKSNFVIFHPHHSPADTCKMWPNCAFRDKSVKFSTKLEHILTNVFSYRAIPDLSRDPSCIHLLSDVIKNVFLAVCAMFFTKEIKLENNLVIYVDQTV